MKNSYGFTLIELLIALGISAIVAVGTVTLFRSSIAVKDSLLQKSEYDSQLSRALRMFDADLTQLVPNRPVRDEFGNYKAAISYDKYEGLSFTRSGWANSSFLSYERSILQRVNYRLEEPGSEHCPLLDDEKENNNGGCLVRSYTAHLDDDGTSEWIYQSLLRPVNGLEWQYLIHDASSGELEWSDELLPKPNRQTGIIENGLKAIKIKLEMTEDDVFSKVYVTPELPPS